MKEIKPSIVEKLQLKKVHAVIGESFMFGVQFYVCPKGVNFAMCDQFGEPSENIMCLDKKGLWTVVTPEFIETVNNDVIYQILTPK